MERAFYLASVILLLAVVPIAAVIAELSIPGGSGNVIFLAGKWLAVSAVGLRLLLAGAQQLRNPAFTAETIFDSRDPATVKVVAELGVGNIAIGMLGLLAVFWDSWILPAAFVGAVFYLLAGLRHLRNSGRNSYQQIAMVSDLAVGGILAAYLVAVLVGIGGP